MIGQYWAEMQLFEHQDIFFVEKIAFKIDIFTVGNIQNIFMEHDLNDFWRKIKMYDFEPYSVLLAIPVLLMTGFVLQYRNYKLHTLSLS